MESNVYLYEKRITGGLDLASLLKNCPVIDRNEELHNSIRIEMSQKALDFYLFIFDYIKEQSERINELLQEDFKAEYVLHSKGSSLFGGYFCSDPIEDLIIGNTSRGRLLKRKSSESNPHYFSSGKLVKALHPARTPIVYLYDKESIVYEIDCSLIDNDRLYCVKCEYDNSGRIAKRTKYMFTKTHPAFFMVIPKGFKPLVIRDENKGLDYMFEIKEIQYFYDGDRISSAEINNYVSVPDTLNSELYKFSYDGDYYSDYSVFEYINGREYSLKALKKRKFDEFLKMPDISDFIKQ